MEQKGEVDTSGYKLFSEGELGAAHVMAHRMLDERDAETGYQRLGAFLEGKTGRGSAWSHIQWHMLVFELELGKWEEAQQRFMEHVLPAALSDDALTDAPAGLLRLALTAPPEASLALAWMVVRTTALERTDPSGDPYVCLHSLVALAGSGDRASLEKWLVRHENCPKVHPVLVTMARGLLAYVEGRYDTAMAVFASALPDLRSIGGSRAQNEMFLNLYRQTHQRAMSRRGTGNMRRMAMFPSLSEAYLM